MNLKISYLISFGIFGLILSMIIGFFFSSLALGLLMFVNIYGGGGNIETIIYILTIIITLAGTIGSCIGGYKYGKKQAEEGKVKKAIIFLVFAIILLVLLAIWFYGFAQTGFKL